MMKFRTAHYCNLKLLLIFLVIYGHCIESNLGDSTLLRTQYYWIYLVHMPLFSFLSGLFLHDSRTCIAQIRKLLPIYLATQTVAVLAGATEPLTPYWHLWYLFSCCIWCTVTWFWYRLCHGRGKLLVLFSTVLVGCTAGLVPEIGYELSLSRTLVFFPYFFLGVCCQPDIRWHRYRPIALFSITVVFLYMLNGGSQIPVSFLYQATPYRDPADGPLLRLFCYLIAGLLGLALLALTPTRFCPLTKLGIDTMPAYLFHVPLVLYLRELPLAWWLYPPIILLYLYVIGTITQRRRNVYGIVSPAGKEHLQPEEPESHRENLKHRNKSGRQFHLPR